MATAEEVYKLKLAIEGQEDADKLRYKIDLLEDHIDKLRAQAKVAIPGSPMFQQLDQAIDANVAKLIDYRNELAKTQKQIQGSSLVGADRAATKFRAGLAGANILQDAIQGGPASTINNILGIAGDGKLRALGGEAIAAAGGIGTIATVFGTVAVAAGAAFLVIDNGLKNAKLGWSDLDDVIGNLAPFTAAGEAFSGLYRVAEDTGLVAGISSAWEKMETFAGSVAEATIGWRTATEAVKLHNEEVARGVQAALDYTEAVKDLKNVRSDEQKQADDTGKLVGKELADLGGAGGVGAVADKLSKMMTLFGGDHKVKVQEIGKDDKGKEVIKEVEVTQREKVRRDIMAEIGRANGGDTSALDRLTPLLKRAGYNTDDLGMAARGIDPKKEAEEEAKAQAHFDKQHLEGEERAAKAEAKALEDRAKAEKEEEKQDKLAQEHFDREHQKGEEAYAKWQYEGQKKIDDENMNADMQDKMAAWQKQRQEGQKTSQVFNDASSLRDAIQQAVKGPDQDPTAREQLEVQRRIEAELKKANEMKQQQGPARLG